ncbi:hypothetical protein EON67_00520 [archaeon]|nr:MAG: hypothetical protein EON67_00520 [archaeon]
MLLLQLGTCLAPRPHAHCTPVALCCTPVATPAHTQRAKRRTLPVRPLLVKPAAAAAWLAQCSKCVRGHARARNRVPPCCEAGGEEAAHTKWQSLAGGRTLRLCCHVKLCHLCALLFVAACCCS